MNTRIFTLLIAFLAIAGNAVWGQETTTSPGTETIDGKTFYLLDSKKDLEWFRDYVNEGNPSACAKLTDNITLDSSEEWTPIMATTTSEMGYTGTFDGDGKTIKGLSIESEPTNPLTQMNKGLFGIVGMVNIWGVVSNATAVVKNLTIEGCIKQSHENARVIGGICGLNFGTIQNCINKVSITSNCKDGDVSSYVGGICGQNNGTIEGCSNESEIYSFNIAGGICGINGGTIVKSYNEGNVSAGDENVTTSRSIAGGICGHTAYGVESSINNCYNAGTIKSKNGKTVVGICYVPNNPTSTPTNVTIINCHNYGNMEGGQEAGICIYEEDYENTNSISISNTYFKDGIAEIGYLYIDKNDNEMSKDQQGVCESKSAKAFASGEVLCLLNNPDVDVWVQTIGMDDYPKFETEGEGSTVYQVTVQPNDAAMGTTTGGGVYVANEEATVTATPNEGYEFINWTIGEEEQSTETTYTFEVTASVTLIANFQKIDEGGEEEPDDDQDTDKPGTIVKPIKYYNIYIDTICPGLEVETSKDVVQEGHQVSAYLTIQAECDTTGMRFEYKRGLFGYWQDLRELEGVQPGEYIIKNIYTDIYIRALDATLPEEEPTGLDDLEGIQAYAKEGSIYVYTPNREEVTIVSMSGAILKHEEQVGWQSYNVNRDIYIVRIGDKVFKLKN